MKEIVYSNDVCAAQYDETPKIHDPQIFLVMQLSNIITLL